MKYIEVTGSTTVLAGITWSERYQCYSARIAGWLDLAFSYRDGAYHVSIGKRSLKATASDPESAAKLAVAEAKALLAKAQKELDPFGLLLKKHAANLERTRVRLATDFSTTAHEIIRAGCVVMGITVETWRELETYSIDRNLEAVLKGKA